MTDTTATHVSIGDLLGLLHDEFPDITISKIRFLESQGLIDPERTPSGYRKFYDADVDRLRWILREQKENFLPLKVIKTRLEQLELGGGLLDTTDTTDMTDAASPTAPPETPAEAQADAKPTAKTTAETKAKPTAEPKSSRVVKQRRKAKPQPMLPTDDGRADDLLGSPTGASLTRSELARAAGLTDDELAELETYGLVWPSNDAGGRALFDEDALAVARFAAGFARHGIDARHLRMYRAFAAREATLYQQTLLAVLRQRNPESRARAQEELADLARLGRGLRTAYLRQAARELLEE